MAGHVGNIDIRSLPTRLITLGRPTAGVLSRPPGKPPVKAKPAQALRSELATVSKPIAVLDGPLVFLKALHSAVAAPVAGVPVRSVPT
jgi:hypothetical protein